MGVWELWFALLLLPSTFFIDCEVTLVKITGREPYITPICTNETLNTITLVACKIRTERSRGEVCHLAYKYGEKFFNGCDSRFTFMKKNQTVFLHLTSLTPVDSGNYSCECINRDGTNTLHLNITVEEDEEATSSAETLKRNAVIGVIIFCIITGVILGFIHRKNYHRRQPEPMTSLPHTEPEEMEPYRTFMQTENVLYSTIEIQTSNTNYSNVFTRVEMNLEMPL